MYALNVTLCLIKLVKQALRSSLSLSNCCLNCSFFTSWCETIYWSSRF